MSIIDNVTTNTSIISDVTPNMDNVTPNISTIDDVTSYMSIIVDDVTSNMSNIDCVTPNMSTIDNDVTPNISNSGNLTPDMNTIVDKVTPNMSTIGCVTPNMSIIDNVTPNISNMNDLSPKMSTVGNVAPSHITIDKVTPNITSIDDVTPDVSTIGGVTPNMNTMNTMSNLNPITMSTVVEDLAPNMSTNDNVTPNTMSTINDVPPAFMIDVFGHLSRREFMRTAMLVSQGWYSLALTGRFWKSVEIELKSLVDLPYRKYAVAKLLSLHAASIRELTFHIQEPNVQFLDFTEVFSEIQSGLKSLDLSFNSWLDFRFFQWIVYQCPAVVSINFEGCPGLCDRCLEFMRPPRWPALRCVNLSHCEQATDVGLRHIAERGASLETVNLDGISGLGDLTVAQLVERNPRLQFLSLDGASLNNVACASLGRRRTTLTFLNISFCEQLTDQSLEYLGELSNLVHLHLRKAFLLTADGILSWLTGPGVRQIRYLRFSEVTGMNDQCARFMARGLPLLEVLCLDWCWGINDAGLDAILEYSKNLRVLSVLGLKFIRGASLSNAPGVLPKLEYFDLRMCNQIEDDIIKAFVNQRPYLTILNYYGEMLRQPPPEGTDPVPEAVLKANLKAIDGHCCLVNTWY